PQIVIASYDGIAGSKKLRGALNASIWDVLIMDEAHRTNESPMPKFSECFGRAGGWSSPMWSATRNRTRRFETMRC
ncbi:MAG: hypothetical protein R6U50_03515, partial [Desulfobacterales bacterium]